MSGYEIHELTVYKNGGPCTGPVFGVRTETSYHAGQKREDIIRICQPHPKVKLEGINGRAREFFKGKLPV